MLKYLLHAACRHNKNKNIIITMTPLTIKLSPFLLTLATGFGVLFHDTSFDRATLRAVAPTDSSAYIASPTAFRNEDHTHTETVGEAIKTATDGQPRIENRVADQKRYLNPRKVIVHTSPYGDPPLS